MKMNGLIFVLGFIIAFAGGYFIFTNMEADTAGPKTSPVETQDTDDAATNDNEESPAAEEDKADADTADVTLDADVEVLARNNCLSCHAIEEAGLEGGTTGPDLSIIYNEIEGKHGKTLDEFLQEPTSAVMSSVIEENPLEEKERKEIVKLLKEVAEN